METKILWIGTSLGNLKISEEEICTMAWLEKWFLTSRTELENVFYIEKNQWKVENMFIDSILKALINSRLTVEDIDGIFLSHSWSHWDKVISLSSLIATKLGMNKKKWFIAKDINSACVGFWDALDVASKQIKSDGYFKHRNYIVAAGDNLGSGQRELTDIKTGMFSDWVASMIISNNPDWHSKMNIMKTWSAISQWVDYTNVKAISQSEGEKITMHDGKALSTSLLYTADEIFSLLSINKLTSETLIIPHQPNGRMITKRSDNSKIISKARKKWHNIVVHKETYKNMGNLSGASVLFGLDTVLKEWSIPSWCKRIILAPFGAGWHIAWAEIKYKWEEWWLFKKEYKRLNEICEKINKYLYDNNAPISYKLYVSWWAIPDISKWVSWFLPQKIPFNKLIWTIDVFHWQSLKYHIPDKEFVTKTIYYEFPENKDADRIPTFYNNNKLISWKLNIYDDIKCIWATKSGKNIRQVSTFKDGVKIVSEFCEILPISNNNKPYRDVKHNLNESNNIIDDHEVNAHWSIWWYVSSFLLEYWLYDESARIDFLWWGKIGDAISVYTLESLPEYIKLSNKYSHLPWGTKVLFNETNNSLIAITYLEKSNYNDMPKKASWVQQRANWNLIWWLPL